MYDVDFKQFLKFYRILFTHYYLSGVTRYNIKIFSENIQRYHWKWCQMRFQKDLFVQCTAKKILFEVPWPKTGCPPMSQFKELTVSFNIFKESEFLSSTLYSKSHGPQKHCSIIMACYHQTPFVANYFPDTRTLAVQCWTVMAPKAPLKP